MTFIDSSIPMYPERTTRIASTLEDRSSPCGPGSKPACTSDTDRARRLLAEVDGLGVRDAIHAAVMLNRYVGAIATFDRSFDRVPGVERVVFA